MADKKVTVMVIKTDLECEKCRKKIKKILCKIPEIHNQIYDEKANTVTISVVCCCPEKIKKKICCKGRESIKGIEIKVPEKHKPQDQKPKVEGTHKPDKPKDPTPDKPKDPKPEKKPKDPASDKPKDPKPDKPTDSKPANPKDPKADKPKVPTVEPPKSKPQPPPEIVPGYPPPVRTCCRECYEGYGGPCYNGYPPCYGTPVPCYKDYYGRPVYDSWGSGGGYGYGGCRRGCHAGRCDCCNEDYSSSCSIM